MSRKTSALALSKHYYNMDFLSIGSFLAKYGWKFFLNFQKIKQVSRSLWKKLKKQMYTYSNDDFAHDTIRYRFRDIIHTLNNDYADAVVKTAKTDPQIKLSDTFPFSYKDMMWNPFSYPDKLLTELNKLERNYGDTINELYDSYFELYENIPLNKEVFSEQPFIDVEHFFYFYLLDKFYGIKETGIKLYMSDDTSKPLLDPYKQQKKKAIIGDLKNGINTNDSSIILRCLEIIEKRKVGNLCDILENITFLSLESNTNDLSQLRDRNRTRISGNRVHPNNLKDFTIYINSLNEDTNINYLVDNSGVEFFTDLAFAYILLTSIERIKKITLHINVLPIFVSDVIESDYEHMMTLVEKYINDNFDESTGATLKNTIKEIKQKKANKEIEIVPNFIWNMPTPYKDLVEKNKTNVFTENNSLLIIKGDLNYRRLVEDKNWSYKDKIEKHTKYLKCPTLIIRSIKSDLVIDFGDNGKNKYKRWKKYDPYWRENGEYGVIRFINNNH